MPVRHVLRRAALTVCLIPALASWLSAAERFEPSGMSLRDRARAEFGDGGGGDPAQTDPSPVGGAPAGTPALSVPAGTTVEAGLRSPDWRPYRSDRHGFAFDYPAGLFASRTALPDGVGETLVSTDGTLRLSAFALPDPAARPLAAVAADYLREAGNPPVGYRRLTRNGHLVISGNRGDEVFYLRLARGGDGVHGVELRYLRRDERRFDALVTRVSLSFRPGF